MPGVSFFLSKVNIPGLNISSPTQNTPFLNLPLAGEKVDFNSLYITCKVPSSLTPFTEIYNWIKGLGRVEGYKDYQNLLKLSNEHSPYSDGILTINSNLNIGNIQIHFHDCVPVSLGDIYLDIELTADTVLEFQAEFKYTYYTIEFLN